MLILNSMEQLEDYFRSKVQIPDIIYIGIGSACVRDSKPENMQQFPPWLESEYYNTNKTFCIINIDPRFESPYLLTQRLPIILDEEISSDSFELFITDRLECIYINDSLAFTTWDNESKCQIINESGIKTLHIINELVMQSDRLLISGIYTGESNSILDDYFSKLYSSNSKYSTNLTYNFMNDSYGSCMVNLLENYPLVDYSTNQIIKVENSLNKTHIYKNRIIGFEKKLSEFAIGKLKSLLNLEIFLYRNYLNKSYGQHMDWTIKNSSFKDINILDYTNFELSSFKMRELIYNNYIDYLLALTNIDIKPNNEIIQTISYLQSIPSDPVQIYTWISDFSKVLVKLNQIYLG